MLFSQTKTLYTAMIALALVGAFQMVFHTMNTTIIQNIVPDAIRGRVMSIYLLDHALVPLGALFAGTLATITSAPTAIFVMGSLALFMVLGIMVGFPHIRRVE